MLVTAGARVAIDINNRLDGSGSPAGPCRLWWAALLIILFAKLD
jgi:hypothetical protein